MAEWTKEKVEWYKQAFTDEAPLKVTMDAFNKNVKDGSTILEIGSGLGIDYAWFKTKYKVIGSDYSREFIKVLEEKFGDKFLRINAIDFETEEKFDVIYANKVHQQFTEDEMKIAFKKQADALVENGLSIMNIWKGEGRHTHGDTEASYFTKESLMKLTTEFEMIDYEEYGEFDDGDSFIITLRKRK